MPGRHIRRLGPGTPKGSETASNLPGTETIANRHSRSTASPSPPSLFSSPRWIRPGTSLRDRHARLSHGSVNGSPSTAAAETKTRNCRLGRGASARARHCCAGRRSCAGYQLVRGLASRMARPTNRRFLDPPIEPARERRQQLAPFHSKTGSSTTRSARSYLRLRTASLSGRLGAGHEPQQSSSSRAAHRRGDVHHRPRSQHWSMLGKTDTSHGPRADTVDD
jgi:hypothetical protein